MENKKSEKKKSAAMRTLTLSLAAASALVLTVIIVLFNTIPAAGEDPTPATSPPDGAGVSQPAADLGYLDPESTGAEGSIEAPIESTEAETTAKAPETTAPPVLSLAFSSNGDGTCYVSGIGSYPSGDVSIPTLSPAGEVVTGIGKYAFYNETGIIRITIPSTVRSIGEYAFLGCSALLEVTVSSSNTAFTVSDGLLYSKDGSRLILCPAMRGKSTCILSRDVTAIERGAFSGVTSLKTIYYRGSAAEWTAIEVGAHNELLDSVRLVCNYNE